MAESWIKSPTGRRVLVHWADTRPAWLWSQDGETLLWRNAAARLFQGRIKKHGLKLAPEAVPIKGQVARLLRLGTLGRSSLSRIQFLAGDKPFSRTCTVTPLQLDAETQALLVVGVDAIDPALREADTRLAPDAPMTAILPAGSNFVLLDADGVPHDGSDEGLALHQGLAASDVGTLADAVEFELDGRPLTVTRFTADAAGSVLLLFERSEPQPTPQAEPVPHPTLPAEPEDIADTSPDAADPVEMDPAPLTPAPPMATGQGPLSSLFDRLAEDQDLYAALDGDEPQDIPDTPIFPTIPTDTQTPDIASVRADEGVDDPEAPVPASASDPIAALIEADEAERFESDAETSPPDDVPSPTVPEPTANDTTDDAAPEAITTWRIIGRGFTPVADLPVSPAEATDPGPLPDAETVERVSRYNFDALTRILTDRVSGPAPSPAVPEPQAAPAAEGALVSLAGETLVLNRLPIGILVFRDQQVLFANRSLIDLVGHDSVEGLRNTGLPSIFPTEENMAGPVTQLVRRDGRLVPVNARLQSITWHGRPALMLSASAAEIRIGHEGAVRTFAELAAHTAEEGFLTADRAGVLSMMTLHGRILLGLTETEATGRPISAIIDAAARPDLVGFLEKPARFAETARPSVVLATTMPAVEIVLFAEGQAGIVAGYFGFVRKRGSSAASRRDADPAAPDDGLEPSMLARISRGIRRPLNTVIGFAEIMRSSEPGKLDTARYVEYARDIKTAGEDIATLVGELDDYSRLREGRYPLQVDELDLSALLETCLARVRTQASDARVLVRSAVSEQLPRIAADRASLTQAVLNLLASAIDQTPAGGSVILSAQRDDTGGIVINVRDNGDARRDLGERFLVFRDGVGRDGEQLGPVRSSVGLALTRSLLAVNALKLSVDPMASAGTRFSMLVPADLVRD